jgi:hypothetical protein
MGDPSRLPQSGTAGAFSILVDADVKGGVFHGEKGDKGKPGWFLLDGKVQSDGTVELVARGLVNSSLLAAGNVSVGTEYGYRVVGRLAALTCPLCFITPVPYGPRFRVDAGGSSR